MTASRRQCDKHFLHGSQAGVGKGTNPGHCHFLFVSCFALLALKGKACRMHHVGHPAHELAATAKDKANRINKTVHACALGRDVPKLLLNLHAWLRGAFSFLSCIRCIAPLVVQPIFTSGL